MFETEEGISEFTSLCWYEDLETVEDRVELEAVSAGVVAVVTDDLTGDCRVHIMRQVPGQYLDTGVAGGEERLNGLHH